MILHERFRKLVAAAAAPVVLDESEPEEVWEVGRFPGIERDEERSDPVEEEVAEGEEDESFDGGKEVVEGGVG